MKKKLPESQTEQNIYTLKVGGQAGQGIKSVGLLFAKAAVRSGYQIYDHTEYPSLIRGGHNVMQISFSTQQVTAPRKTTDLLVALNQETINKYKDELKGGTGILYDVDAGFDVTNMPKNCNQYAVPLKKLAEAAGGKELLSNTVALGAVIALWGGNLQILDNLLQDEFEDKGAEIIQTNQKAAELGYNFITQNYEAKIKSKLNPIESLGSLVPPMIVNGNDAVALGAIAGGLQFAAIYPMSPISGILHTLALYQEKYGYVYKQPEDEISAINMAIGAGFAGARSMTATSGGGFCLMTEAYGLAGMTETPVVIVDGMRGGPATGLPTWSGQGDLQFVLHAHQGEFPRIVLAAGDALETFNLTRQAFNLAEKYQTPVVLLIDKNICENDQSFEFFNVTSHLIDRGKFETKELKNYQRYKLQADGISVRSIPGVGNYFIANSDEHDEAGFSNEEIDVRNAQMKKRMTKLETCAAEDMAYPQGFGSHDAKVTIVSWGSNKGSILEALKHLKNVNYLHLTWMNPFPAHAVKSILSKAKHVIDIECNYTGQLAELIKEKTGFEIKDKLLRDDGRPFYPEEIIEKVEEVLK
jgi:2-oxoglutarate/2-oxoacid ferredoxin oxidoreductase subunit alpha